MNDQSQAYAEAFSRLSDAVCAESKLARWDRVVTDQVIAQTLDALPDNNPDEPQLRRRVLRRCRELRNEGVIVVGFFAGFFFEILIGIVVALIVRWIVSGGRQRDTVMQARGKA